MSRKDLSHDQRDQLAKLADLPDSEIDTSDIPEAPAENWIHARRGNLYRPVKQPVTIRLDADVLHGSRNMSEAGAIKPRLITCSAAM
nr:hypothetical protein [Mesorhizobium sp. B2-3-12]